MKRRMIMITAGLLFVANSAFGEGEFKAIMGKMGVEYKSLTVQMRAGQLGHVAEEACNNLITNFDAFSILLPPMIEALTDAREKEVAISKYHDLTSQLRPALITLKASVSANDMDGAKRNLQEINRIQHSGHDLFKPSETN